MKANKETKYKSTGEGLMSVVSEMGRACREQQRDGCYYCRNEKCKRCAVATATTRGNYEHDFGCKVWKSCEMISAGVVFYACPDCYAEITQKIREGNEGKYPCFFCGKTTTESESEQVYVDAEDGYVTLEPIQIPDWSKENGETFLDSEGTWEKTCKPCYKKFEAELIEMFIKAEKEEREAEKREKLRGRLEHKKKKDGAKRK